jgi:hypothetical protein
MDGMTPGSYQVHQAVPADSRKDRGNSSAKTVIRGQEWRDNAKYAPSCLIPPLMAWRGAGKSPGGVYGAVGFGSIRRPD